MKYAAMAPPPMAAEAAGFTVVAEAKDADVAILGTVTPIDHPPGSYFFG